MSTSQKRPKQPWSWRSQAFRGLIYQIVTVAVIVASVLYLAHNTKVNMSARGIQSGWDFMLGGAGFDIGESLFAFDSAEPYWKAYLMRMEQAGASRESKTVA